MRIAMQQPRVAKFDARKVKPPPKTAESFYLSAEWRALIALIIKARGRRCEDSDCPTPNGPWSRIYGDHVIEIKDGGPKLDPRNVLLRCHTCHARKTVRERSTRIARSYKSSERA